MHIEVAHILMLCVMPLDSEALAHCLAAQADNTTKASQ